VIAVAALLVARFGVKAFVPGFTGFSRGMMWSFWGAGAVLLWWLLLSRARWFERLGGVALIAGGLYAAWQLRHPSMSLLWVVGYAVPAVCLALVAGAAVARRSADGPRRATIAGAILLASLGWLLVRTEGISGDHVLSFQWRWTASPEERLLARIGRERVPPAPAPAASASPAISSATVVPSAQPTLGTGRCREARPASRGACQLNGGSPTPSAATADCRASAGPSATASCTASASPPAGRPPPSSCGAARSGRAGRPLR
jgi:hypothetical protein